MENKIPDSVNVFKKILDENKTIVFTFIVVGLVRLVFPPKIYQEIIVNPWGDKGLYKIAPISIGNLLIEFIFTVLLFLAFLLIKENKIAILNFCKAVYQNIYFQISTFAKKTTNSRANKEKPTIPLPLERSTKNFQVSTNTNQMGAVESIHLIKERFKTLTSKEKLVLAAGTLVFLFLAWRIGLPWYAEYQYRVGYGHQVQNRLQMAMDSYKKAVKAQPLETQYQIELGKVYEDFARAQNDPKIRYDYLQKAEQLYNTMVKLNPENPWYQNRLAEIYNLYSQYFKQIAMVPGTDEAARKDAEHKAMSFAKKSEDKIYFSATLDPNNPLFKMSIAYLYHQRGQFEQAIKEYQKIIAIDDQFAEAYFNMADIYIQQKKLDMALSTYDKINQFRPNFNNLHLMIGKIYLQQGKAKAAKEEFIKELEGNRNNVAGYQMLGSQLYQERDFVNASKILSRAVEMQPTNAQYIYFLGICYINTNQFALAQEQFQKVLELAPGNPQALQAMAFVRGKLK